MKKAIGIDLGGTKIEAALVDEDGNKLDSCRVPTGDNSEDIFKNLKNAVENVQSEDVAGIGIGTPGFFHDHTMASNPNIPDLRKALDKFFEEYPDAVIENDANCFALAEHRWGAGKKCNNMVGLIWGTGIGAGIIIDGKLLKGTVGGAGEVGHIVIDKDIPDYEVGGPGTWEYYCSGPNIVKGYHEEGGDESRARPDEVFASGDEVAKRVQEAVLKYMGVGLGILVNTLNPELIILGGGVSNLNVYKELNDEMRKHSVPASGKHCNVVKNKLGDTAGVLGAAALVFERRL